MKNKLSIIFLILVILLSIYGLTRLTVGQSNVSQSEEPSPTPFPTLPPKAEELKNQVTQSDKKSGDLNLETSDDYEIIYLISNDQFIVRINKPPYREAKSKAENWFINKGFTQEDLCELNITFVASRDVTEAVNSADLVPTNCPVP